MAIPLRILDAAAVRSLAPLERLIPLMADTMRAVSAGNAFLPLRTATAFPGTANRLGVMIGELAPAAAVAVKLVSLVPDAAARGASGHTGLVVLYDAETLSPKAILCGATITALRTAATSAAATDALARRDSRILAVLGAGEQAEAHIAAIRKIRPIDEVRIWARRFDAAAALLDGAGIAGEVCATVEEAVEGADIVCTTTGATTPILHGAALRPGMHVNLVGSSFAGAREIDDEGVRVGRFVVDYRASAMAQAGELLGAIEAGVVTGDHIVAEIGEVLAGKVEGRRSAEEITIYKSLGVAAQDIATAEDVLRQARARSIGVELAFDAGGH